MHSALNLILMTRDKDLRRWGRLSAGLMIFLGCFLLGAVAYSYSLVDRIEAAMQSAKESEQKLVARVSDERVRDALTAGMESGWTGDDHLIDGARAVILGGGISFAMISFYTAALSWRAYELAATREIRQDSNKQVEQDV